MEHTRVWMRRVMHGAMLLGELILLYVGLSVIFSDESDQTLNLLAWNLVAFAYLGVGGAVMRRRAMHPTPLTVAVLPSRRGVTGFVTHLYLAVMPAVFSVLGLTAAVIVLFDVGSGVPHDQVLATKALAALVMVSAWGLLHVSYSRTYRLFYLREGGGLDFPETPRPSDVDFLYFAMTLGSSFTTSDVSVTSTRMRWRVLGHSVLSFFYNAIVLAVAFRVLTGG